MSSSSQNSDIPEFIILGGGGHARVVWSVLLHLKKEVVGYTAPEQSSTMPCTYLGSDEYLLGLEPASGRYAIAFGLGLPSVNPARLELFRKIHGLGFPFPPVVSPEASVAPGATLGNGTVVLAGSIIATGSRLGRCCIVNHRSVVDHDCTIGDNVHLSPGTVLCGNVSVGESSMVGAGAVVIPQVTIGDRCQIGAGSTVICNADADSVYIGSPARRKGKLPDRAPQ